MATNALIFGSPSPAVQARFGVSQPTDDLDAALQCDLVKVPKVVFAIREYQLPLTDAQLDEDFSDEINFFSDNSSNRRTGVSGNTLFTNAVELPFLARCISVYFAVEPFAFAISGSSHVVVAGGETTPAFDGIVRSTPIAGTGMLATDRPAALEWGYPTWRAAHAFMQAYRMQLLLGGKLELFNELAADVGCLDSHSPWEGFSSGLIASDQYVRIVNDRYTNTVANGGLASDRLFLPPTVQDVAPLGATDPDYLGVPAGLAPAAWGGPCMDGLFGGCYPTRGLFYVPGMPINIKFIRDGGDTLYHDALLHELGDQVTATTFAASLTEALHLGNGWGSRALFKGGVFRVGIAMRGFELTPRAALLWYARFGNSYGMSYYGNSAVNACISNMAAVSGLSSLQGIGDVQRVLSGGGDAEKRAGLIAGLEEEETSRQVYTQIMAAQLGIARGAGSHPNSIARRMAPHPSEASWKTPARSRERGFSALRLTSQRTILSPSKPSQDTNRHDRLPLADPKDRLRESASRVLAAEEQAQDPADVFHGGHLQQWRRGIAGDWIVHVSGDERLLGLRHGLPGRPPQRVPRPHRSRGLRVQERAEPQHLRVADGARRSPASVGDERFDGADRADLPRRDGPWPRLALRLLQRLRDDVPADGDRSLPEQARAH